jgi:YD repeat-containing protein
MANKTTPTEGWKKRNVRYEQIHNVDEKDMVKLVESLEIANGGKIADLMCGYGAVSREIAKYCAGKGLDVSLVLVEMFKEQLDRSYEELKGISNITRILSDARNECLEPASLDGAIIKMGVHEVPQKDQQQIVNNVYKALKEGRIFSMWDVMPESLEEQLLFQDIIRKKDELAGFDSLVKNRYFFRQDEAMAYFVAAGFKDVEHVQKISYRFSSENRLEAEFGGIESKLMAFNDYIRTRVPESMKEKLQYNDSGRTIEMTFTKGIVRGRK